MNPAHVGVPDSWGESTSVDSGDLIPVPGMGLAPRRPVVENEEEPTMRADTDSLRQPVGNLHASIPQMGNPRAGTMDEPTVDRHSEPPQSTPRRSARSGSPNPMVGKLVVIAGNDNGREVELDGTTISVGRGLDNQVVLTDIAVSRKHLSLEFDGRQYILVDHGSGNGTVINDRLETGRCNLRHGDRLELGNTVFRFEHPASRSAARDEPRADEFDEAQPTAVGHTGSKRKSAAIIPGLTPQMMSPQTMSPQAISGAASQPPARSLAPARRRKPITLPPPNQPLSLERAKSSLPLPDTGNDIPASSREFPGPAVHSYGAPSADVRLETILPAPNQQMHGFGMSHPSMDPFGQSMNNMSVQGHSGADYSSADYPADYPSIRPSNRKLVIGLLMASVVVVVAAIGLMLNRASDSGSTPRAASEKRAGANGSGPNGSGKEDSRKIPASTWGTNETLLVASVGKTVVPTGPTVEPGQDDKSGSADQGTPGDDPSGKTGADSNPDDSPDSPTDGSPDSPADDSPDPADDSASGSSENDDKATEKTDSQKTDNKKTDNKKTDSKKTDSKKTTKKTASKKTSNTKAAIDTANDQYKSKAFSDAAQTLRSAAGDTSPKQAKSLKSIASSYDKVGSLISTGNAKQSRDPVAALSAYDQAYRLDKKVGRGTHSSFLQSKLSVVAPKAAASHMAQKRYEAAKTAADKAATYGAGSNAMVKRVRQGLERQAEAFYKDALRTKSKDKAAAKKTLQRIMKIVPASSPSYSKAAKLLSKLG